eukprot:SAG31_NODE_5256_length_2647_cov_1.875981_3_plen_168_part_00
MIPRRPMYSDRERCEMGNCVPSKEDTQRPAKRHLSTTEPDEYTQDLIDACSCGDAMLVAELLSNGASPSAMDPNTNGTALMIAAATGQSYCLSLLIDAGALVDQKHPDFGMTALLWCVVVSDLRFGTASPSKNVIASAVLANAITPRAPSISKSGHAITPTFGASSS